MPLWEIDADARLLLNQHPGQLRAWDSERRFVLKALWQGRAQLMGLGEVCQGITTLHHSGEVSLPGIHFAKQAVSLDGRG
jgi:hypothetical protein